MGTGNGGVHKVSSQRQERGQDLQGSEVWPNFFIVGAAKAGTTSLHMYLERHPQVYMCPMMEPHFFSRVGERSGGQHFVDVISDKASYLALFKEAAGYAAVGERSCSYLGLEETADVIREQIPDARIMILLRDPIERAHSHYLMDVRGGIQKLSFYESIVKELEDPEFGWGPAWHRYLMYYYPGVKRYRDVFGPERVLVLLTEDLMHDPRGVTGRAVEFLGLAPEPVASISFHRNHNTYSAPRNGLAQAVMGSGKIRYVGKKVIPLPILRSLRDRVLFKRQEKPEPEPEAVDVLSKVFASDLDKLEGLLGRPLPELRRSWKVTVV
jgi:Sulfotransferase family